MTGIGRPSARPLLFDADHRLLLFLARWHHLVNRRRQMKRGAGALPGESEQGAMRRELLEETGVVPLRYGNMLRFAQRCAS